MAKKRPKKSKSKASPTGGHFYELDLTAQGNRHFAKDLLYSAINWKKLDDIVDAFRQRIDDWYLGPAKELAKNGHFAFSVMGLCCLLIDMMSQFYYGESGRSAYKKFVRNRMPGAYSSSLTTTIRHSDSKESNTLVDYADVLYHGFRCGILHDAHVIPYGLVDPDPAKPPVSIEPSGYLKYKDSREDCPAVIVNPLKILSDIECVLTCYLNALRNRDAQNDDLRTNFKGKFKRSFGIDIDSAD